MLIRGPTELTEAWFAMGMKTNLLQNGINSKLQVLATTLGPTVVIKRYKDTDTNSDSMQWILTTISDTVILHGDDTNKDNLSSRYHLVAWSIGSRNQSLLVIASSDRAEIWEVVVSSGISATLKGYVDIDALQGISWNPCYEILLAFSKTKIMLINALQEVVSWRDIYTDTESTYRTWSASSWSPCGLQVSLAQNHILHCFSWTSIESMIAESPKHDHIDANSALFGIYRSQLDAGNVSVGPIAAVARVSPTICILTTDAKLVLGDITCADDLASSSEIIKPYSDETTAASRLLVHRVGSRCYGARECGMASSNDIIDLTSIRASTTIQNPLCVLTHVEDTAPREKAPHVKPRSHLLIVEYKVEKWTITSILDLPHLFSPDVLFVQEMQAIVGSTLSSRLLIVHMDIVGPTERTASLSGKLELPPMHVCRGLYVTENPSIVSVASTEKRKRAPFFHAVATLNPFPVFLSKFKVSPRVQDKLTAKLTAIADNKDSVSCDQSKCNDGDTRNKDLLNLILVKVMTMQTQMNIRFDDVDKKLQQLTARLEQLE